MTHHRSLSKARYYYFEFKQILDFNPTSEAFDENNKFKARFLEKLVE